MIKNFKELLEKGADISLKDTDGNNALHLIVKPETKQKLKLLNILLETGQKEQFIKAVNDKKKGKHRSIRYSSAYKRRVRTDHLRNLKN